MRGIPSRGLKFLGLTLLIALVGSIASYAQNTPLLITMTNTIWKYRPNTNDPGYVPADAWTAVGFDDSSWPSGHGLFGYESTANEYAAFGDFHTYIVPPNGVAAGAPIFPGQANSPLSAGPSGAGSGGPSAYFRTHFNWSGATVGVTLNFTNTGDDGWIFYLNGTEIYSFDVPATRPMTWDVNNLPNGANPLGEAVSILTNVVAATLVAGDNVLAAELHQQANTSSDDVLGVSMYATLPQVPTNLAPNQPTNRVVRQNAPSTLIVSANGAPAPSYQWFEDGLPITGANSSSYTFTNTAPGNEVHQFYCHVANIVGSFDSRTAQVTFSIDTQPPQVVRVVGSAKFDTIVVDFDEFIDPITGPDPFNYTLTLGGNQLGIAAGSIAGNGSSVILTVGAPLDEGALYDLAIRGVGDLANNYITEIDTQFRSWVSSDCPSVSMEVYNGTCCPTTAGQLPGTTIAALVSHPSFPDHPSEVARIFNTFDTREVYGDDSHEEYGGRLRSLFVPPVSGKWRFFIRTDDPGQLWFNPNGADAGGRTLIAEETGCCNAFLEPNARQTSAAIDLIAGQGYYLEALWREIGGGDYCQVAARLEGDVTPAASLTPIPKEWFGSAVLPGLAGPVAITRQPATQTVPVGGTAFFDVGLSRDVPGCYQWLKGGAPISGAIGRTLTLTPLPADEGDKISVQIIIPGNAPITSAEATLHVVVDHTPPVALSASADVTGTKVTVTFDEAVDATTGQNAANYKIDNVAPLSATIANGTNVILASASVLATCVDHTVVITGVEDLSQNPLAPNPTTLHFEPPIMLVNQSSQVWHYNDLNTDLGTAWTAPGYDDSTWPTGHGVLGWEEGVGPAVPGWEMPVTNLFTEFGAVARVSVYTTYLRTKFTLPTHPASVISLDINEVCDDAAAVYLNGQVLQLNRLTAPFTFTTLGGGGPEPVDGTHTVESFTGLPKTALVQGENTLAVEMHQSSTTSSDVVWGCQLIAVVDKCGVGLTLTPVSPTQARVDWTDATYHVESAPVITGPWTSQPGITPGSLIAINSGNRFLRLVK